MLRIGLALLLPVAVCAQVSTGTIIVQVQDISGASAPGAAVTLTRAGTGQTRQGSSNDRGEFLATFLPVGNWSVSTELTGFKRKAISGLELRVDQTARITVVLEPGEVREVVTVTEVTPLLETGTSSLGQVIDSQKILNLPMNGRNPYVLGLLAGNTTPVAGMGTNLPFIGGGGRFSANEVMLDGVDNNTVVNNGSVGRTGIAYAPPVMAMQEFKVKTNNFSAEFGHSAGTVINATIRSGANDLHGSLFEFLRNDKLDANNFLANAAGRPKAAFRQNQLGGSLGGPIIRNRTFFFMDYQATRQRTAAGGSFLNLPPADYRQGDFSRLRTPVFDPYTRRIGPTGAVIADRYLNNRITPSHLNPTSVAITGLVPLPNFGDPGADSRNYFREVPRRFNGDQWDARIDHRLSDANNLFGRFSFGNQVRPDPGNFDGFIGGGNSNVDFTRHFVLNDTHVFSPTVINEFRFGYVRHNGSILGSAPEGVEFAERSGLALFPFVAKGFPAIHFNFSGLVSGNQQFNSWGGGGHNLNFENRFQWADNLNITRGAHTFKTGVDVRRTRFEVLKGAPFFGEMVFGAILTSSSDTPGSGVPLADFLVGFPTTVQGTQMLDWGRQRDTYLGGYFQDDWKATRNLTLNLGIRYDLYAQPYDARDRGSLFDVDRARFQLPGKDGFSRAIVDGDHNNIAPRVGLAWQARKQLVIRGGYGLFYGLRDQNQQVTAFAENNPNTPSLALPTVTASATVRPPFTLNTPITVVPDDVSLAGFTPQRPLVRTLRTQGFHNAYSPALHQFNVSFQYEPFATWLFEMALSAARGRDLASSWINRNQIPFERALERPQTQADRPFPNVNGPVIPTFGIASSSYHAVNFKVEKRFSQGLDFLVNYSIQKNLERGGTGPSAFSQNGGTSIVLDSYNLARERSLAPIDVPQVLVISYSYELPWGPGRPWLNSSGPIARILGGWQVNGITYMRGGFPTDIRTNRTLASVNFSTFNVADRVPGQPLQVEGNRGPDRFFNPAAFRVPGTVTGRTGQLVQLFGDSARRVARGPGSVNFDFSIFKDAAITERYKLRLRGEFFNLTNTPTFFLPAADNATLTCMGPAGAACDAGNANFGKLVNGSTTGRQIQFGLVLTF